ncbi:hypothetical protein BpHYR1_006408, partial [Brachionus plicatilis]
MKNIENLKFSHSKFKNSPGNKIFYSHVIHSPYLARKFFPKNNSIYVTIIRDPVKQYMSYLNYNPNNKDRKELIFRVNEGTIKPSDSLRKMVEEIIPRESNADYVLYNHYRNFYEKIAP